MAQALTDKPSVTFRPPVWNWSKAVFVVDDLLKLLTQRAA